MPYVQPAQQALPWQSGSETSHEAAVAAGSFASTQEALVLQWFQAQRIARTQKEASSALGVDRASMCARVRHLEILGAVVKTTQKRDGCFCYLAS